MRINKNLKYTKKHINKKHKNRKYQRGGLTIENSPLPTCDILAGFQVDKTHMTGFVRMINSPMDCVINALQIIGLIDMHSANIMRISNLGIQGFQKIQIELIFILYFRKNFSFMPTHSWKEFTQTIETNLQNNQVAFGGYTGHVFVLARHDDGNIFYIDPQLHKYCNVKDDECANLFFQNQDTWYLLHHSNVDLTEDQYTTILEYINYMQSNVAQVPATILE